MKNFYLWRVGILLAFVVSTVVPITAIGAVYKSTSPDGSVSYSDQPQVGAEEVDLPPVPPPPPPPPAKVPALIPGLGTPQPGVPAAPDPAAEKPPFTGYTVFTIVTPENDSTLRENSGAVTINLAIEPALQIEAGHKITLIVDGKPTMEGLTATQIQLGNINRGTHTLQAQVNDANGASLATTDSVTIHLKRISTIPLKDNPLLAPDSPAPDALQAPRAPQGLTSPSSPVP
ncbi:MAG: DUF4124 domain-containing protein [Gammaproteobacteria bacterium]